MKKTIVILGALLIGSCAMAEDVLLIKNITLNNFWDKKVLSEEKVLNVGNKILVDNKIPRRIPIFVINDSKVLNATSNAYDKKVSIYTPMFFMLVLVRVDSLVKPALSAVLLIYSVSFAYVHVSAE